MTVLSRFDSSKIAYVSFIPQQLQKRTRAECFDHMELSSIVLPAYRLTFMTCLYVLMQKDQRTLPHPLKVANN